MDKEQERSRNKRSGAERDAVGQSLTAPYGIDSSYFPAEDDEGGFPSSSSWLPLCTVPTVLLYLLYSFYSDEVQKSFIYAVYRTPPRARGGVFSNCTFCTLLYSFCLKKYILVQKRYVYKLY